MCSSDEGRGPAPLPDFSAPQTSGPALLAPSEGAQRRSRTVIIAVVVSAVAVIAVVALVLSQTLFARPAVDDPRIAAPTEGSTASGQGEYIPDPEDPNLAPPPPIFTEAPSAECAVVGQASRQRTSGQTVRGGALEYTRPAQWTYPWNGGDLSYMTDYAGYARHVEGSWYSVVNVGRVSWPEEEGPYPGMEQAAVTIFQCYATSAGLIEYFGDTPEVTDYRTEATTVDGHEAWIVQATYHYDSHMRTTDQSRLTAIVVDTPGGPSALASDVAADHPDQMADLQAILDSLRVVG